jgi:hypothetical protein
MLPVGLNLSQLVHEYHLGSYQYASQNKNVLDLSNDDLISLRVRGRDMAKMEGIGAGGYCPVPWSSKQRIDNVENPNKVAQTILNVGMGAHDGTNVDYVKTNHRLHLEAVFFPLLSSLLRRWHKQIMDKYGPVKMNKVKKVLILVSGVGTPRNWTHSKTGNSTEACAKLMEIFIKLLYPDVVVVLLHSHREIFRYDENIAFANKELLPCVNAFRDAHARGEKYPGMFTYA